MIPIIYPATESAFTSRGYGPLPDCISCIVTEELNGAYTCELTYPKNGLHEDALQVRNIIKCSASPEFPAQLFRIYKVNRSLTNSIAVYANQISYDYNYIPILPQKVIGPTNAAELINQIIRTALSGSFLTDFVLRGRNDGESAINVYADRDESSSVVGRLNVGNTFDITMNYHGLPEWWFIVIDNSNTTGWVPAQVGLTLTNNYDFVIDVPSGVRSWFAGKEGSLLDIWGGEFRYYQKTVNWLKRRGEDNGARISYGVNMAQYVKEITEGCYSAIIPYFAKKDGDTLIERTGDELTTGFTDITKKLTVDVTDQFSENYGKNIPLNMGREQRDKEYTSNPSGAPFPAVGNTCIYIGLYPMFDGAYIDGSHVDFEHYTNGALGFHTSQANIGVGVPFPVAGGIHYEAELYDFGSSTEVYVTAVFVGQSGNRISRSGSMLVSDGTGDRSYTFGFTTPEDAAYAVITLYRATSGDGNWPNHIYVSIDSLISIPSETNVTDAGNVWLAKHPSTTDEVTYSVEPEAVAAKVNLGDSVHISYGSDQVDSRVVKTTWDALLDRYTKFEIGTVKKNIATTIKSLR